MEIHFTDTAVDRLKKLGLTDNLALDSDARYFCTGPDTSSLILRSTEEKGEFDQKIDSNLGPVKMREMGARLLDEKNVIDFDEKKFSFISKSERGLINSNLWYQRV